MTGILFISPEERARVEAVARHAERPENLYLPGKSDWTPGDTADFGCNVGSYRLVFTITQDAEGTYRHLTVSSARGYPSRLAVFTLATWCGFTGGKVDDNGVGFTLLPGPFWMFGAHDTERCVVVIEPLARLNSLN